MKNIKKSEISLILKDADSQSIQGEVNVDKENNEFSINVKGKFIVKEPKLMESKMSKEEMTQFSLIIKEAIKESQNNLEKQFISFKNDVNSRFDKIDTRLDGIEGRLTNLEKDMVEVKDRLINVEKDVKLIKNTPTMKKELEL